ncbi:MAG: arginyltransferase, partial [Gammaproteobacteria bacterium]
MMHDTRVERLSFYATPPHPCSYLPNREAVTLFADPRFPKTRQLYTALSARGFRRSGEHLYQPHCQGCSACVPVRIPVADYRSNRQQRRTWRRNQDLTVRMQSACYDPEHFALYQRYIAGRHAGGGMDDPTPESYMNFLTA